MMGGVYALPSYSLPPLLYTMCAVVINEFEFDISISLWSLFYFLCFFFFIPSFFLSFLFYLNFVFMLVFQPKIHSAFNFECSEEKKVLLKYSLNNSLCVLCFARCRCHCLCVLNFLFSITVAVASRHFFSLIHWTFSFRFFHSFPHL